MAKTRGALDMARPPRDPRTIDLFDVPQAPPNRPGSLACDRELRHVLSGVLKQAEGDRYAISAEMSRLVGTDITKHQIDSWAAESREGWRFPLAYAPAFEAACNSYALTEWLAELRGCRVLVGEEALLAELGRIEREEAALKARRQMLKQRLGGR